MKSIFVALTMLVSSIFVPTVVHATETISKLILIQMSRNQSSVFCQSEAFTQCMAFSQKQCMELAETAIDKCLGPMPQNINLAELENSQLEVCPQQVYEEAGFSEEKAKDCFDVAIAAEKQPTQAQPAAEPADSSSDKPATDESKPAKP